jgi:hypothetical protein
MTPTLTDRDAATAVVMKLARIRICASLDHRDPTAVSWRNILSTIVAMDRASLSGLFSRIASAGLRVAISKVVTIAKPYRAAVAATAGMLTELLNDDQSTEALAKDRTKIGHGDLSFRLLSSSDGIGLSRSRCAYRSMKQWAIHST